MFSVQVQFVLQSGRKIFEKQFRKKVNFDEKVIFETKNLKSVFN